MPLFTFKCEKCEKIEDRIVKHNDVNEQICSCDEQSKMKQEFNPSCNFILKGSWFKNSKSY
jgi:predicted nucleic acid-binding Zn ribbon protein